MRVFLDTNILLDVIEARPGLVEESADVFTLAEHLQASGFEDAMQCVCAESCLADVIITRNTKDSKDFTPSPIRVLSPADFLQQHGNP